MRTNNIIMLEHDASIEQDDVTIGVEFINDQEMLCVDVMIEKIGFRVLCNVEGLKLKDKEA